MGSPRRRLIRPHAVVRDGPLESTVDEAFEAPTWLFREQLAELTAAARTKSPHQA